MSDLKPDNAFNIPEMADQPIPVGVAIGAVALNMAIKFCDATVVKDGVMYQQLKLENKKIGTIGLDDVFDVAQRIERHLIDSNKRIQTMMLDTIMGAVSNILDAPAETEATDWTELREALDKLQHPTEEGGETPPPAFTQIMLDNILMFIEAGEKLGVKAPLFGNLSGGDLWIEWTKDGQLIATTFGSDGSFMGQIMAQGVKSVNLAGAYDHDSICEDFLPAVKAALDSRTAE